MPGQVWLTEEAEGRRRRRDLVKVEGSVVRRIVSDTLSK